MSSTALKVGLPPSGPESVLGHPDHLEWLRKVQARCAEAIRIYPENREWHLRGHNDYLMEEVLILLEQKEKKEWADAGAPRT